MARGVFILKKEKEREGSGKGIVARSRALSGLSSYDLK
jgi:hypothetical protein